MDMQALADTTKYKASVHMPIISMKTVEVLHCVASISE